MPGRELACNVTSRSDSTNIESEYGGGYGSSRGRGGERKEENGSLLEPPRDRKGWGIGGHRPVANGSTHTTLTASTYSGLSYPEVPGQAPNVLARE